MILNIFCLSSEMMAQAIFYYCSVFTKSHVIRWFSAEISKLKEQMRFS